MKTFKKILKISIVITLLLCVALVLFWISATSGVELNRDLLVSKNAPFSIYDAEDNVIFNQSADYVKYESIPRPLIDSFIAVEDKRFFDHNGIDLVRIVGAGIKNLKNMSFSEGASTITQQLIKNTHLSSEKTITRKLQEIKLAIEAENELTKEEILESYLNKIYFGNGYYGIVEASKGYFNKELNELSIKECACLAGIVKNPSKYSPTKNLTMAENRANLVLSLMKDQDMISSEVYNSEITSSIILNNDFYNNNVLSYTDSVLQEAENVLRVDQDEIANGNYKIYTYYSPSTQDALYASIENQIGDAAYSNYGIVVDTTSCGIIAYTNSTPYFNAYTLRRSPGSVIKPFIAYLPALVYKGSWCSREVRGVLALGILEQCRRQWKT